MITLKRILVPTDLSEYSAAALDHAASFAFRYGADLFLLHVGEGAASQRPGAMDALRAFMQRNVPRDVVVAPVLRFGAPADEIRRYADEERMDLIVMATHGRTGLRHILMGSVAERVVRLAGVPVLTVKPSALRDAIIRPEDIERDLHLR